MTGWECGASGCSATGTDSASQTAHLRAAHSRRATQMRASFLQPGGHLRVVWWVSNTALRLDELVDDAAADLRDVLVDKRLTLATAESWHVADADGSSWLVMDADARAWLDPRRDASRRSTTT